MATVPDKILRLLLERPRTMDELQIILTRERGGMAFGSSSLRSHIALLNRRLTNTEYIIRNERTSPGRGLTGTYSVVRREPWCTFKDLDQDGVCIE